MSVARTVLESGKLPLPTITLDHPLDKIFGDIPARLQSFTHASVMHYIAGMIYWTFPKILDQKGVSDLKDRGR